MKIATCAAALLLALPVATAHADGWTAQQASSRNGDRGEGYASSQGSEQYSSTPQETGHSNNEFSEHTSGTNNNSRHDAEHAKGGADVRQ